MFIHAPSVFFATSARIVCPNTASETDDTDSEIYIGEGKTFLYLVKVFSSYGSRRPHPGDLFPTSTDFQKSLLRLCLDLHDSMCFDGGGECGKNWVFNGIFRWGL